MSSFATQLRDDDGDYAVLYYPVTVHIVHREHEMWDQVQHGKRLLIGFFARVHTIPALVEDPAYAGVLRAPFLVSGLDDRMARLEKLFASPRYRVKYLVVLESRWKEGRKELNRFLKRMKSRYPRVRRAKEGHSRMLPRLGRQWAFYVGGESFEHERKQLVQLTADLRSRRCGDATELGRENAALRRRWRDFEKSTTSRERSSAKYESLSEEIRDVLAGAGGDCTAETTPRR